MQHELVQITASREVETVKAAIRDKYGFEPPDAYCRDLIAFVDAIAADSEWLVARICSPSQQPTAGA